MEKFRRCVFRFISTIWARIWKYLGPRCTTCRDNNLVGFACPRLYTVRHDTRDYITVREEGLSAFCVSQKFFYDQLQEEVSHLEPEFTFGVHKLFIYDRHITFWKIVVLISTKSLGTSLKFLPWIVSFFQPTLVTLKIVQESSRPIRKSMFQPIFS